MDNSKNCRVCKTVKSISSFYPATGGKFGVTATCIECRLEKQRSHYNKTGRVAKSAYQHRNRDKIRQYQKSYAANNKDKLRKLNAAWRKQNADHVADERRKYAGLHKDELQQYMRCYRQDNANHLRDIQQRWNVLNHERVLYNQRKYRSKHRERLASSRRRWEAKLRSTSPEFRLGKNVSRGINHSLRLGGKSGRHWETLVGYSIEDLKRHLESLFRDGMTWENYGIHGWHIDHVTPKSWFTITTAECEAFRECWSLSNLQPMWAQQNVSKQDRYKG